MDSKNYLNSQLITCIGNKRALLNLINQGIAIAQKDLGKKQLTVLDGFAGSGIVSRFFKSFSSTLYSNDFEYYAYVIGNCYLANKDQVPEDIVEIIKELNTCKLNRFSTGLIEELYAPEDDKDIQPDERAFYTNKNARIIDNIRRMVGNYPKEYFSFCIAPLLSEASVKVNTSGVFKGFYKDKETKVGKWGGTSGNCLSRIKNEIVLPTPVFSKYTCDWHMYNMDINKLVAELPEVDVAYYDPPYNQHPYGSNYFMLNLISKYKRPDKISKVAGIPMDWQRSEYNKSTAKEALSSLIESTKAKYILLSYSNEGIISVENIQQLLSTHGEVTTLDKSTLTFRASRNLHKRKMRVNEYLFILKKN